VSRPDVGALLAQAIGLHQAGRLKEALEGYQRVVALDPDNADANAYMGLALHHRGASDAGVERMRRAIALAPDDPAHHANLGVVLFERGDREGALSSWRETVRLDPQDADARFQLGLVLGELGRWREAEQALRGALALAPADASCQQAHGNALRALGHPEQALAAYASALELEPRLAGAAVQAGSVLASLGRLEEAEGAYRRALEVEPASGAVHHNLAGVLLELGRAGEALGGFRRAAALEPRAPATRLGEARAQVALGRHLAALEACREALALEPDSAEAMALMASSLARLETAGPVPAVEADLQRCLASAGVDWQSLAGAIGRALGHHLGPEIDAGAGHVERHAPVRELLGGRLWLAFLRQVVNVDPAVERFIARARSDLLERALGPGGLPDEQVEQAAALAIQAFLNEYVVPVSARESEALERLWARLSPGPAAYPAGVAGWGRELLVAGAYRPLAALPDAALDAALELATGAVAGVLARTVSEPLLEQALAAGIPAIAPVEDATSRAVREQYEAHPYPRWQSLAAGPSTTIGAMLRRRFPHHQQVLDLDGPLQVLVAGCGTGREALDIARSCPQARVTAVDLSRRSLAYGQRMAQALGIERVRFLHGDILALHRLERRFPVIICTGVLHHMQEPLRGWRVLERLLEPGGVMRVGLYSRRARAAVQAARDLIAQRNLAPTHRDITALRAEILDGRAGEACASLAASEDLYTTSACRDLLFHVCEHGFDPLELRAALERLGLAFLGFELPDPAIAQGFRAAHPGAAALADLGAWELFERDHPGAFVGMYQFWCAKAPP
jgi:tetratricopeptide (TPR) repeat protein/SAM-dependent methyltransferase